MNKREPTDLDLTLAGHPLNDEVESEEVNEVDGQLEEFLKNSVAVIMLFYSSYLIGRRKMKELLFFIFIRIYYTSNFISFAMEIFSM